MVEALVLSLFPSQNVFSLLYNRFVWHFENDKLHQKQSDRIKENNAFSIQADLVIAKGMTDTKQMNEVAESKPEEIKGSKIRKNDSF